MKKMLIIGLFSLAATAQASDVDTIRKGEYLARMGDCASCHTIDEAKPYAGGNALPTPFGVIYSPNITSDESGIGDWSFEEFYQALHEGLDRNGYPLYPAFSYTSFTKVSKDDARAIFAYLQSLEPIRQPNKKAEMFFPYNIRSLLHAWRTMYFTAGEFKPDPNQSERWNRGAYLVEGLGHCNECHSTRNALGAVNKSELLAGNLIPMQGWYAPGLSTKTGGDLEGWTRDDLKQLLKTGTSRKGGVIGPMADVVRNSTQFMTEEDLDAVVDYLQSIPAPRLKPEKTTTQAADFAHGRKLYQAHCTDCHGDDGEGVSDVYPPLAGNTTVTGLDGVNAIRSVLLGGFPPATQGNPEPYSMPPYAGSLNDAEVAAVVNYIRQSWGNAATAVNAGKVNELRTMAAH